MAKQSLPTPILPSRYESLNKSYRAQLRPVPELIDAAKKAHSSIKINKGVRFLPVFGESGSGKSSATLELATHLPEARVELLTPNDISLPMDQLQERIARKVHLFSKTELIIWVIDQYEEIVEGTIREKVPSQFIEKISIIDRGDLAAQPMLFIWLTTSKEFRDKLVKLSSSRSRRTLLDASFDLNGPERETWIDIIKETFLHHNEGRQLADYDVLDSRIIEAIQGAETIGDAIDNVGGILANSAMTQLLDLSAHQVVMLWPVVDGTGINRVASFTKSNSGYSLNWTSFWDQLTDRDKNDRDLDGMNRARIYFDFRLIPIPAADFRDIVRKFDISVDITKEAIESLQRTHYYKVISRDQTENLRVMFERESQRSADAKTWYESITADQQANAAKMLAKTISQAGYESEPQYEMKSDFGRVVADLSTRQNGSKALTELKLFSPRNTTPSAIRDQIKSTLRKYAKFSGFLQS
ncbi:MAG: ATP-binding protein [Planctomycetota bacterium]